MASSNGNDEFNEIQMKINQKTNQQLESTRNMLNMVAESKETGINTMIMLDEQGEKLNKIENGLDNINAEMYHAEEHLSQLEKCCGLCHMPWSRPIRRKHQQLANSSTTISSERSSPTTTEPKLRMTGEQGMSGKGYITRITNDDREEEMDDNLQIVSDYLGDLKNIALDMGDTITNQSQQIDRITDKSETESQRVDRANKKTRELIRKA